MIIGKRLIRYSTIDSTNSEAKRLIRQQKAAEGTVLVAERQTAGRGKPGSCWYSPPGNLYLSAIVKPFKNPRDLIALTFLGALAGRTMLGQVGKVPVVIKWPNDLLAQGKKIGGVLCERLATGEVIIGLGLNLNRVPIQLKKGATSLRALTGRSYRLGHCLKILLRELDREYLAYLRKIC